MRVPPWSAVVLFTSALVFLISANDLITQKLASLHEDIATKEEHILLLKQLREKLLQLREA